VRLHCLGVGLPHAADSVLQHLGFCYFFVEQLKIIERSLWLLATQNNLTKLTGLGYQQAFWQSNA
jgi:hypothetical protein